VQHSRLAPTATYPPVLAFLSRRNRQHLHIPNQPSAATCPPPNSHARRTAARDHRSLCGRLLSHGIKHLCQKTPDRFLRTSAACPSPASIAFAVLTSSIYSDLAGRSSNELMLVSGYVLAQLKFFFVATLLTGAGVIVVD
jgi:hypothetical protein